MSHRTVALTCFALCTAPPLATPAAPPSPAQAAARDRPMVPMPRLRGRLMAAAREEERGVRRVYEGSAARVERAPGEARRWIVILDGKQPLRRLGPGARSPSGGEAELPVTAATPDRDRFTLDLPENAALPLAPGDTVRAELRTVEVGEFARDSHARLWRNGEPLLFINELPDGWTAKAGAIVARDRAPMVTRSVVFTPPVGAPFEAAGFVSGTVGGAPLLAYGSITRWEGRPSAGPGSPMVPPPEDFAATFATALLWTRADR